MQRLHRTETGMSLVEVLSAMFIMTFIAAAMAEIAMTQNCVAFRTYNKIDGLLAARAFQTELEREIHTAHLIGAQNILTSPYVAPTPTPALTSQRLTIQVPVYCSQTPSTFWLPSSYLSPTTGQRLTSLSGIWNVDTYVYQIAPDSSNPGKGQFVLQKSVIPGYRPVLSNVQFSAPPPYPPPTSPQTILKGIVGPINPSDPVDPVAGTPAPDVFKYFKSPVNSDLSYTPIIEPGSTPGSAFLGVSVDLELFSNSASSRADLTPQTIPLHSEYLVRANALQ